MAEDKNKQWLTVAEVTEKIGVPVETLRRYIRTHGVHLKVKKVHKRYVIHDDSLTVFRQIRELYADGKNSEEIEQTLTDSGVTMTVTVNDEDDEPTTVSVAEELRHMNEALEKQEAFNELLLQELKELKQTNQELKEKLDKRDEGYYKKFDETMKLIQEAKQARLEVAASEEMEETKVKKGFWAKLFK